MLVKLDGRKNFKNLSRNIANKMIKILITDDSDHKIKRIREIIERIPEIGDYDIAIDLVSTKKHLSINHYDLLILDLNLPDRMGDDPLPTNGVNFLLEFK